MKKKLSLIAIVIIFLVGVGVLSYPLISAVVNNIDSRGKAKSYQEQIENLPDPEIESLLNGAKEYNKSLLNNVILTDPFDEKAYDAIGANYEETLNTDESGTIGYIDIPKINVYLPIYHGTSLDVLGKGAGHLENSSMPIGGENTHAVISAHSAYPTQTFFDYLTEIKEGDYFYVHVLNEDLKYEVDQIKVVLPDETTDLNIIEGGDYVTLLTCTPYSVNTHRLLVRGKRVAIEENDFISEPSVFNGGEGSLYFFGYELPYWEIAIILASFIAVVLFIILYFVKRNKKKHKYLNKEKSDDKNFVTVSEITEKGDDEVEK